ncbi:MAG: NAD-dependent DNA ligase LigA [Oliverpabstia sp.]|nr:NAD-dependent DNA ligase LigA [Eubacterium sp.]MDY2596334.1 NAD-dependent DNA ligase LigA [Oliverpabstia sp.]
MENRQEIMKRMKELVEILGQASRAYYQEDREIMSNLEYDALYDELVALEQKTGIVLSTSPTVSVGYEAVDELPKETHESPMLSLDKTKDREVLRSFIGNHKTLLSWKMDGLTIVLTYRNGVLEKAVTRGNGVVGEVVTNNARVFDNIPHKISFQGELILRGEAIITYSEFEKINRDIADVDARYKNPRNLCSGSVRQLNNKITAGRHVRFYAFSLVKADGADFQNSRQRQMEWLEEQGFETVEYRVVTGETLDEAMEYFAGKVAENDFPSDGLVALYDDIAYGDSLGRTAKFPRNAFAFKWADEMAETTLEEIEWSPSRTGLINPVAIFTPVELEGSTVSRASVHNISIMRKLELGIGDRIRVYKANMIIPQIGENLTRSGVKDIPECCPACHGPAVIEMVNDVESLYCRNSRCPAKAIKGFTLFVSRDAMNIDGLSEATLEKFIGHGLIGRFGDIFELEKYRDEIVQMEGFGEKSCQNLLNSIEKARKTELPRLIYALGIPNIGLSNAKVICQKFGYDLKKLRSLTREELAEADGIGPVIAGSFVDYFADEDRNRQLDHLLTHLVIQEAPRETNEQIFAGLNFVITGNVEHFANRNAVKAEIEKRGGKVTGSVTSKTNYLINNDVTSNSSKNKKAKELQIPIISENDFIRMLDELTLFP